MLYSKKASTIIMRRNNYLEKHKKKPWKAEEIQFLLNNWDKISLDDIVKFLDRTVDSVTRKARRLGLDTKKPVKDHIVKKWTTEEDIIVIDNYNCNDVDDFIHLLTGRSYDGIVKRAKALGLAEECRRWTEDEEEYLCEKWGQVSLETIAKNLNRTWSSIYLKAFKLGLREQISANGDYLTPRNFSEITGTYLRTVYDWIRAEKLECRKFRVSGKKKYQISIEQFKTFLIQYQHLWSTKNADMSYIKSCYAKYTITTNDNFNIHSFPEWLLNKIEYDKTVQFEAKDWTTQEVHRMFAMKAEGATYRQIAHSFGRSIGSVKTKIYLTQKQQFLQHSLEGESVVVI